MKTKYATARRGLLAGGNWLVDYVKVVDVYPRPEQLGSILSQVRGAGGSAYNVLVALARLGAPFPLYAAGLVGRDAPGRQILQDCRHYGIDASRLRTTNKALTSFTDVISEQDTGRRTFFHYRGANALWCGQGLDFHKINARIFHFGYFLLLDQMDKPDVEFGTRAARLLASAQQAGLKTSVDAVSIESDLFDKIIPPALKYADYCIFNEIEAGKVTGFNLRPFKGRLATDSVRRAAIALSQMGVRELVAIHFPEGVVARTRSGQEVWQASLNVPPGYIAGTAGAGDAFCAGLLLGLHEGWDLRRSLKTAVCVATASLSHPTTTGGIKSLRGALALARTKLKAEVAGRRCVVAFPGWRLKW